MKTFKLTKGVQIILITLFIVTVGIIIVASVSNNRAMALSCSANCGSGYVVLSGHRDENYHYYKCGDCGASAGGESHAFVADAEPMGDEKHGWYYLCTVCKYGKSRYYTTGVCSDSNSDNACDYCGGWTDNTGGSSGGGGGGGDDGGDSGYEYDWYSITQHYYWGNTGPRYLENHTSSSWADQGDGTHWALCSKCGGAARFDHNEVTIPAVKATCTTAGKTAGKKCSDCGAIIQAQQDIPAGHIEVDIGETVEATCTTEGSKGGKKCSVCGVITQQPTVIPAKGHTEVEIPAVEATCTTAGKTAGKKCSVCNTVTKAQTDVAAKGHTEVEIPAVAATCITAGKTAGKKCSVCNTVTKEQTTIEAKGHTEVEIPAVAATCTTSGKTAGKKCSVCNTVTKEQTTIAAKGHTEVEIPAVAATCTTAGKTAGKKCSVCGIITKAQTTVAALGHNYENGTCTKCGQEEPISEIEITSTTYKIEGTYIYVQPSTEVSDFKSNISTNASEINVYGNDEELSDNETIATGMTIELKNGEINKVFTIIVKGDVNSDGVADFKDLVKINKARLNKITLEEMYVLAADVNEDASVDLKDLSKVNRFRLNKITLL